MTDIERRLRDLGTNLRGAKGATVFPNEVRRSVKRRRRITLLTSALTVAALVAGGSYAITSLDFGRKTLAPAQTQGTPGPSMGYFTGEIDGDPVALIVDGEIGFACLSVADTAVAPNEVVSADVVLETSGDVILGMVPSPDAVTLDEYPGFFCIGDVAEDLVRSLTGSTEPVALSLDAGRSVHLITLELADSSELPDRDRCTDPTLIPFEPTYVPEGWSAEIQPGSAAGSEVELVVGHYGPAGDPGFEKMAGGFLDVIARLATFEPEPGGESLRVLGYEASLIGPNANGGYSVRFGYKDCVYTLGGNAERSTIKRFAEGLRLSDDPQASESDEENFAAIWPEDNYADAKEACAAAAQVDVGGGVVSIRTDAESVALEFGFEVLGWEEPGVAVSDINFNYKGRVLELRRDSFHGGHGPRGPAVLVFADEVFPGCWSVGSVSRMPEEQPEQDGSMTVRGREVSMGFADFEDAVTAELEIGYSGETTRHVWKGEEIAEFQLDFDPHGTGHFLVLLLNSDGDVFSAFGSPLPEGDFAAG
jgi:hypothetical protein